jgi:hypothetical protein
VEATDECPAPFYAGKIDTEDGEINPEGNPNQATGGGNSGGSNTGGNNSGNTGGNNSGNTGGNSGGNSSSSSAPSYNSSIQLNGQAYNVTKGGTVNITGNLTSMRFTGSNMSFLSYKIGNEETEIEINSAGSSASCNDVISAPKTVKIIRQEGTGDDRYDVLWFTINLIASSSTGGNSSGNTGGNTGGSTTGGGSTTSGESSYDEVFINGEKVDVSSGRVDVTGPLYALFVKGKNMKRVAIQSEGADEDTGIAINDDKTLAGSDSYTISGPTTLKVFRSGLSGIWFTIYIAAGSSTRPNKVISGGTIYDNTVVINGRECDASKKVVYVTAPLTSITVNGKNMLGVSMSANSQSYTIDLASNKNSASWSGSIDESASLQVQYKDATGVAKDWFKIIVNKSTGGDFN